MGERNKEEESRFQYCTNKSGFPNGLLTQSLLAIDISTLPDGAWWTERYAICEQVYWRTLSNNPCQHENLIKSP